MSRTPRKPIPEHEDPHVVTINVPKSCSLIEADVVQKALEDPIHANALSLFIPIGTWERQENGAAFQAAVVEFPKQGDGEDVSATDPDKTMLYMRMDPEFLSGNENTAIRRRLLFDEDGADKRMVKLVNLYCDLYEEKVAEEGCRARLKVFRKVVEQCDCLRYLAKRTYYAIQTNVKALKYWEEIMVRVKKDMDEMRHLVVGLREKVTERKKQSAMHEEKLRLLESLSRSSDRVKLEEEIRNLRKIIEDLKAREEEMSATIMERKAIALGLFNLVKQLNDDDPEVMAKAVDDIEKNAANDVMNQLD